MIYITMLIFVKEGKEETFLEFESHAIPLMQKYSGQIIYRIRPSRDSFISAEEELPYEIHFISFESDSHLTNFMNDDSRLKFIHLKNESIKSTILIKGEKM
ncbi:DUF1330 domain-containing protein [Arcticibacterium luteifluviistationis]|uniref:DUF1330 domain-containing protein n=1 Tax=Arcticibacterium luteifluviistationis TaxID=1784714 RepID=A0A2Z4GD59_9BACT|nr:DUF1330 domain-containing protein [Arcticibacterium luteifluviistationis]AWV99081.1 DUF1330 domain-containing protein [Arcticibacterium luteifluviistationis]